jgi:hypothetical protein
LNYQVVVSGSATGSDLKSTKTRAAEPGMTTQQAIFGKINPYTQAMINCLQQFSENEENPVLDDSTSQFLANMIQGRFLQFLANRICKQYQITDKELEKKLTMSLMKILSDKFFAVFRQRVSENPEIVFIIARQIARQEICCQNNSDKIDALFIAISQQYFKYQNFEMINRWIYTNPEIERIIFVSQIQKRIKDTALIKALLYIVQNDKDGIAPSIFNRYLTKNRLDRLDGLVKSGDWQIEAMFVQQENAKMINWRNYMSSF